MGASRSVSDADDTRKFIRVNSTRTNFRFRRRAASLKLHPGRGRARDALGSAERIRIHNRHFRVGRRARRVQQAGAAQAADADDARVDSAFARRLGSSVEILLRLWERRSHRERFLSELWGPAAALRSRRRDRPSSGAAVVGIRARRPASASTGAVAQSARRGAVRNLSWRPWFAQVLSWAPRLGDIVPPALLDVHPRPDWIHRGAVFAWNEGGHVRAKISLSARRAHARPGIGAIQALNISFTVSTR